MTGSGDFWPTLRAATMTRRHPPILVATVRLRQATSSKTIAVHNFESMAVMKRLLMGSVVLLCLVSPAVWADKGEKDETVQMAPTKALACDAARAMAERKAIRYCGSRDAIVSYQESDCRFTDMGKNSAATVKTHTFCAPRK